MEPARKKPKLETQARRSNRLQGTPASTLDLQPDPHTMEPARKKPKLETQVRRSNRLQGIPASDLELQPALKPHEICCANFGNVVLENKLFVKDIQTSNLERTKRFFQNLFKKEFNSEANSKDDLLENLRDFFKSKYNVDSATMSPGKPTPQTIFPSTSQATFPLADANNTLPKRSLNVAAQFEYAEELSNLIKRTICHRPGIFNIMVNHEDLTVSLKSILSRKLNTLEWHSLTLFDFEKIKSQQNIILFYMNDQKMIKSDNDKLLEYFKNHQHKTILILNALWIQNAHNYRVMDLLAVPERLLSEIESKEDFLLCNDKYHFDILYDINIIIPRTEMEINFILELCSREDFALNHTLQELLLKETDLFEDFIIKLYRHNLIDWSSSGHISFASNSIKKKYIKFLKVRENPNEFTYFSNCVAAAKEFVNMKEKDVEYLSFQFLTTLHAYIQYLVDKKIIVSEAMLNAELYRIFRNVPNGTQVQVAVANPNSKNF